MKHLGDITKINGAEIPPVDCITAGSPCQDLSVAGKRAGLDGERSGLFMEQIRIIKEMREHDRRTNKRTNELVRPRYMVWENVPGALSSGKDKDGNKLSGEDFRCVLEETARIIDPSVNIPRPNNGKWSKAGIIMGNGWSMAWRIHDAQHWGVPQRRKRLALVADFGGGNAPEVLFERKSLCGDFEESEQTREKTPGTIEGSAGETGNPDGEENAGPITKASGVVSKGNGECFLTEEKHMSLTIGGGQAGQGYPAILKKETISFQERAGKPGGGKGILIQKERTGALSTLNNQSVATFKREIKNDYSD